MNIQLVLIVGIAGWCLTRIFLADSITSKPMIAFFSWLNKKGHDGWFGFFSCYMCLGTWMSGLCYAATFNRWTKYGVLFLAMRGIMVMFAIKSGDRQGYSHAAVAKKQG